MPQTMVTSTRVGRMLNSMKVSRNSMPLVPRSMARLRPPVRRSIWKRSESVWRWPKTRSATVRIARSPTLAKTASRSSPKATVSTRRAP